MFYNSSSLSFHFLTNFLSFFVYDLGCDWGAWGWGGGGGGGGGLVAAWFGATFTFLIFYKLSNFPPGGF